MFALVLPLAFIVEFCGYFLIGMGAFWLENTKGLTLIYSRASMILGGMLLPIEMFPAAMQPIVRSLPFASVIYAPARMFVAPERELLIDVVIRQTVTTAVFALATALVLRVALKRLHLNGG
jgi:ABC-2 type transport system permease protein